jgi:hypothetical protein
MTNLAKWWDEGTWNKYYEAKRKIDAKHPQNKTLYYDKVQLGICLLIVPLWPWREPEIRCARRCNLQPPAENAGQ